MTKARLIVHIEQSPFLGVFYNHHSFKVVINSGAETNMIHEAIAQQLQAPISRSTQLTPQADGRSPLHIKG